MTLLDSPEPVTTAPMTDDEVIALAADAGRAAQPFDAEHDREATFVREAYERMHASGYLALPVPVELGGRGATMRQMVLGQLELGRHSGATALASTMHLYLTFVQCWRHRRGAADAAGVLGRIAHDRLVLATSGGSDWVCPTTVATEVEGGYLLNGRKGFCSQAPVATVISTSAVIGAPGEGATVLHAGVPLDAPGVRMEETWDTLGMRGTASHDLVFTDVFVASEKVLGTRPYGVLAGPLLAAVLHFGPLVGAAYLGVAQGALDEVVRLAARRPPSAALTRQVGEMRSRLRVARWSLLGAVAETGEDVSLDEDALEILMTAKRQAICEARTVVDLALEAAGGAAFFRSSPLERAYRDVRGGPFHPLTPEATLELAGTRALAGA